MQAKSGLFLPFNILWLQVVAYWSGRKNLISAFWGVGIIGIPISLIITGQSIKHLEDYPWLIIFVPFFFVYFIFALKSMWACSPNTKRKIWGDTVKVVISLYLLLMAFGIFKSI